MTNRSQQINSYTEISTSSPLRTRPTDKQMGLGSHNLIIDKTKEKRKVKENHNF